MLDLREIAALDEARQVTGVCEVVPIVHRPASGGVLGRGAPGAWVNAAIGMGMNGPVSDEELDHLVRWYSDAGIEPRVEVCPFADSTLIDGVAARGFVTRVFENVFFRELSAGERVPTAFRPPPGLSVERVDPADGRAVREFSKVAMSGFFSSGVEPTEADFAQSARIVNHPRSVAVVGKIEGKVVGAGSGAWSGECGALFGLTVLPEHRRRGVQQALMASRLEHLARMGCRIATISSRPGVATERNARRMGFHLAYTTAIMVKPGPGLAPNAG